MRPMKKESEVPLLVFRGEQVHATYHEEISIYSGNPAIEALPEILDEDEAIAQLEFYPEFDEAERELPAHLRLHLIQSVADLFVVLSSHLDLEQRISRMIRGGYRARNPAAKGFCKKINQKVEAVRSKKARRRHRSKPSGFTILGLSGVGKSTCMQEILDLYPQVIYHSSYQGQNLTETQLVWLILECPSDGSVKGLCLNFFQAVDDILGTNYYQTYAANGRRTVNELIPDVARVAANIHLGVLVIDEVQRLTKLKTESCEKILDFFVELINTIGLPVVLVGTYKAWSVLGSEFRQIRRNCGQGDFIWNRMEKDGDWQIFVEALWQYQYVKNPCKLTPELSHALYWECQGITDFAIKIFMLAQARAITTGKEKITIGLIKSVAKDCLITARDILNALKTNNWDDLKDCEDVLPIDIQKFIEKEQAKLSDATSSSEPGNDIQTNQVDNLVEVDGLQESAESTNSEQSSSNNKNSQRSRNKSKTNSDESAKTSSSKGNATLVALTSNSKKQNLTAYQILQNSGYICSVVEFLPKELIG